MEVTDHKDFKQGVALFEEATSLIAEQREKGLPLAIKALALLAPFNNSFYIYSVFRLLFSESISHGGDWAGKFIAELQGYLQAYPAARYPVVYLEAKHFIAQTYRYDGQTEKAVELYKTCIQESETLKYSGYGYVEMLIGITFNYILLADYESAYYTIVKAEALADKEKHPLQMATVYYYRAGIDRQLSANHDAVLYLIKASRLAAQTNELILITAIGEELASTLYSIGKERYAIRLYEKTLKEGVEAYASALECAESLFSAYELRQSLPDMKRVFNTMRKVWERWSNQNYDALILKQQLIIAMLEGNTALANEHAAKLEVAVKSMFSNRDKLKCLLSLAMHYEKTQQWAQAAEYYKQHYEVSKLEQTTIVAERIKSLQIQKRINSINEEKQRVENLANARRDFFSQVSHEIRSPMNAVIALSGLLADEPMEEGQKQKVKIIKRSSENLLGMINDLLDNAKIEAGKFTIEQIPFSLTELLKDVEHVTAYKAAEKGLRFTINTAAGLPLYFNGDPMRIRQVLINLLSNAIKFTKQGFVTLSVKNETPDGNTGPLTLQFSVADSGTGIEPEQADKIFTGYTQANNTIARNFGGTGLGLKISKELVQLMGGTIALSTEVGKGSVFSFSLPLKPAEGLKAGGANNLSYTDKPFNILIADDLEDNRFVIRELLSSIFDKLQVAEAVNGKQAIELAGAGNYDLIIMDIDMPEVNGLQASRSITTQRPEQKILGASANVILSMDELSAFGLSDFIVKPITRAQLAEKLAAMFSV